MKIGAHISTQGGLHTAFERAAAIGVECVQIFESAPQQWGTARLDDEQVATFREKLEESGLSPLLIHGKYLMNLASPDPECALDHVAGKARRAPIRVALSNSFGFGGTNACLLLGAAESDAPGS